MPLTKESRWFDVRVRFQLTPSRFSVTSTFIVTSALDFVGCSRVGDAYRVFCNVSRLFLVLGQRFLGFVFFFFATRAVFFGIANRSNLRIVKKGERGSFEEGQEAQFVFKLCGRSRCSRADRLGVRGSGGEGRCGIILRQADDRITWWVQFVTGRRRQARALTSQSGVRFENGVASESCHNPTDECVMQQQMWSRRDIEVW